MHPRTSLVSLRPWYRSRIHQTPDKLTVRVLLSNSTHSITTILPFTN